MDKNLLNVDKPSYQTLSDFLVHPFGVPVTDLDDKYMESYRKYKALISVAGYSVLNDDYYIHIKIPSESSPGKFYDVVIQFIPQSKTMTLEHMLDNYVIQFFSNSPSFIYKYAALYRIHGYMIDVLQEKLDPEYKDKLPEKSNAKMELNCDKSIYLACKFILENRYKYMSKTAIRFAGAGKIPFRKLVENIITNKESLAQTAYDIEQQAVKEGKIDKRKIEKTVGRLISDKPGIGIKAKKTHTDSTFSDNRQRSTVVKKKTSSTSTSGKSTTVKSKKRASTSTRKK